jgi:hypothetical protein
LRNFAVWTPIPGSFLIPSASGTALRLTNTIFPGGPNTTLTGVYWVIRFLRIG